MTKDKDKKKPKEEEREDPHRQITPVVTGEAADIFAWLERLFSISPRDAEPGQVKTQPDEMPERIVLCPVYGKGGLERGPELLPKTWKPTVSPMPGREQLVAIANDYYREAQRHCTVNSDGRPQRYCLYAYNNVRGTTSYDHHPFVVSPGPRVRQEREARAADDEDTHRDRLLDSALRHNRWLVEQQTEAVSGVLKLQNEIIRQQAEQIAQMSAERRALILTAEDALDRKQERTERAEWAKFKQEGMKEGLDMLKSLLPAVKAYLSKGKVGIQEGVKQLLDDLSQEQRTALFGQWNDGGTREVAGVLDEDQCRLLAAIADREVEPKRIGEFMLSVRPEQMQAIYDRSLLSEAQLQMLAGLARAAADIAKSAA